MIRQEDISQTSIIERATDYKPPPTLRSWFIGRPLSTADAVHQTIGRAVGLAVFASDALSSTAYATQEILVILAAAGTMAFGLVFPISIAIVLLLGIVTISYEQTIHAYPDGGGAYIVARDNLGETVRNRWARFMWMPPRHLRRPSRRARRPRDPPREGVARVGSAPHPRARDRRRGRVPPSGTA